VLASFNRSDGVERKLDGVNQYDLINQPTKKRYVKKFDSSTQHRY
jgi:hypothetical protein